MAYAHAFQCLRRAARRVPGVFTLPCLWGLLLLLVTVFLWTATALLLQELFLKTFPRPLFSTLVQSACPVVFLFPPAAAALRSTNAWKRGGTDKGLKAPIWQVALAGFLAKDAQALTVESCLRLLQQQQQHRERPSASPGAGSWRPQFLAFLLRPFKWLASRDVEATGICCRATVEPAAGAGQRQQSPEDAVQLLPNGSSCSSPEAASQREVDLSSRISIPARPAPPATLYYASTAAPTCLMAVSRRACAAEGTTGSINSSASTGCGSSCSSDGDDPELAVAGGLETRGTGTSSCDTPADDREALAAEELQVRMLSVKRTLPLTALWLVAQLSFDASLPLLSITSNAVIQSTSVFLCYFLAVVFLKQPARRSVFTWLVFLAGGVGLISSHVPTTRDAAAAATDAVTKAAAVAAAPAALLQQPMHPVIAIPGSHNEDATTSPQLVTPPLLPPQPQAGNVGGAPARHVAVERAARALKPPSDGALQGPPSLKGTEEAPRGGAGKSDPATPAIAAFDAPEDGAGTEKASDVLLGYTLSFVAAAAYAVHTTALKAQEICDPDFDVELIYGLMGMWVLIAFPALTVLIHLFRVEAFMWPNTMAWVVLLFCGLVGTAFADVCWGRAVFLLNPVVASAAANVQIPVSLLLDSLVLGRRVHFGRWWLVRDALWYTNLPGCFCCVALCSFDSWYVVGMAAVATAVVAVTLITAEKPHQKRRNYRPVTDEESSEATEV